ncbi:uncharacterized protein LOC131678477 [Topomyia yanbarensis]|uniref:uncharacterized protein LOC131678477 n=1 Tax=Topomyia yanbarensis TaxID=2498891 RepID=UPI00273C8C6D|nr:uncharacterized protein LOC131678477 [Topomyia yanbarensis]XP_058814636.1 uncharacterized protein LOC131678477 [Topomyia yanbarensis]
MENSDGIVHKTVPPLTIKNVRALQTVHISDESDSGSNSDNENLLIDEVYELTTSDDVQDEMILIVEEPAADYIEDEITHSSRGSSNRQSIASSDECHSTLQRSPPGQQSGNTSAHSSRGNRRKSHHVPKQGGDVVFEEATILTVPDDDQGQPEIGNSNRDLMKNIAMLKSCINYVLEQQDMKPLVFKHNFEKIPKLVEQYNQMREDKQKT